MAHTYKPPYTEIFYHVSHAQLPAVSCCPPEYLQTPTATHGDIHAVRYNSQDTRDSARRAFYRLQSASEYAGHALDEEKGKSSCIFTYSQ